MAQLYRVVHLLLNIQADALTNSLGFQVRAVMYVQTLTSGIMEAVADTEAAIVAALSHRYSLKHAATHDECVKRDMTASMRSRLQLPSRCPDGHGGPHGRGENDHNRVHLDVNWRA